MNVIGLGGIADAFDRGWRVRDLGSWRETEEERQGLETTAPLGFGYSLRNASMGSTLLARRAGR